MSFLLQKSETNFQAAKLLNKNGLHSSVLHCNYYGCYQMLIHIWLNVFKNTLEELRGKRIMISSSDGKEHLETEHAVLIRLIRLEIQKKQGDDRDFNKSIIWLKKERNSADYENCFFDPTKSKWSILKAEVVYRILKDTLIIKRK
jgi:uncharacterized protein (UPF0332 family)